MEDKCKNCEERESSCVPFFLHENAVMHKDMDNERMMQVVRWMRSIVFALCLVVVIVVTTLVAYYTSRTAMWNDTITKLTVTLAEVSDGVYQQPNP